MGDPTGYYFLRWIKSDATQASTVDGARHAPDVADPL